MISSPNWRSKLTLHPEDLYAYVSEHPEFTFNDLWGRITDPTWLPHLAYAGGATRQQIAVAVCAVVRLCLHWVPGVDDRPRTAVETTEAWARGEATIDQVCQSMKDVYLSIVLNSQSSKTVHIIYAARDAAYSVSSAFYAKSAAYAVYNISVSELVSDAIICATLRKYLLKRVTFWQRLVTQD